MFQQKFEGLNHYNKGSTIVPIHLVSVRRKSFYKVSTESSYEPLSQLLGIEIWLNRHPKS